MMRDESNTVDDPCDDCTDWIDKLPKSVGPAVRSTESTVEETEAERLIRLSLGANTVVKKDESI